MQRHTGPAKIYRMTACASCGYNIPPNELVRLDSDHILCSRCNMVFQPSTRRSLTHA